MGAHPAGGQVKRAGWSWATHYQIGDAPPRYFSSQGQPARECPAADYPGATMRLGQIISGKLVVLEVRKARGKGWRVDWRDDSRPSSW